MADLPGRRVITALVVLLVTLPAIVRPQSPVVVFTHANVIDGSGAAMARDMTVTIADGRISDLRPSGTSAPPASARVVDATNKFLIPGLWDMHVHWYDARLLARLVLLANPLENIRNRTRIAAVVANGRLYDRAALDRLLADAESIAE